MKAVQAPLKVLRVARPMMVARSKALLLPRKARVARRHIMSSWILINPPWSVIPRVLRHFIS